MQRGEKRLGVNGRARVRRDVVVNQPVTEIKVHAARQMRQHMTDEEATLWAELRGNRTDGLDFRRQQVIDGFIVDFYCHIAGLVVEVDGAWHQDQADYDSNRDHVLSDRGLTVLRVTNEDVRHNLPLALTRIRTTTRERLSEPTP